MSFLVEIVVALLALAFLVLAYINWSHKYWNRRNIPQIDPQWIFGNVENPLNLRFGQAFTIKRAYDELKRRSHTHGGVYLIKEPIYVPVDIDLIKNILTRDFANFINRGFHVDEKAEPLQAHLFNLNSEKWRNMRVKLTPTFTSAKMKMMFKTLLACGIPMIEHIEHLNKTGDSLDIKDILSCYTTDVIGSCAFGLECNSFKDPNAEFRSYGRKLTSLPQSSTMKQIKRLCVMLMKRFVSIKSFPADIELFFINTVKSILDYRKSNNVIRNDFIQLLLEIQEKAKANGTKSLTLEEITAQVFVFFIAGFETSSTTMTFCLHELAFNQDVQEKLREEVKEILKKNNGILTYDAVMEMKYMDQVVNETLRKYPPVPIINRICAADYKIPGTEVILEKGVRVFISALGLHRDEEYYPDPEKFDPDRFTEENKAKRPVFSFLPFGEGPRNCIGLRFGLMQTKTGLSMILNNFKILPAKDEKYNFDFEHSFILSKKGNVMLTAEKLIKDNYA